MSGGMLSGIFGFNHHTYSGKGYITTFIRHYGGAIRASGIFDAPSTFGGHPSKGVRNHPVHLRRTPLQGGEF